MHKGSGLFAESTNTGEGSELHTATQSWNILIVDDEEQVHSITTLVLARYLFEGKNLNFSYCVRLS